MATGNSPYDGAVYRRQLCAAGSLPRHRHTFGYMCVVLDGHFLEAGDAGRFQAGPGDAFVHRPFEAHADHFNGPGASLLNLPLPSRVAEGRYRLRDLDAVVRLARRDPAAAAGAAAQDWMPAEGEADWPDLLAGALRGGQRISLRQWAAAHGLAAETLSRGFRKAYGTTPARFAAEMRARRAWDALGDTHDSMAALALDTGFADQAHMSRAVRALTGRSPAAWRRVNSVQDADNALRLA